MRLETSLVDWRADLECYDVAAYGKPLVYFETAREAIEYAIRGGGFIVVADGINPQRLVELSAAAIFAGVQLLDRRGKILADPAPAPRPARYITRAEIGNLLPEGWYIEIQNGRYAACFGEQNQLPFRSKLTQAVSDIREFLATALKQTSADLHASITARPPVEEMEQRSF